MGRYNFFKTEKDQVIFTGEYMEFYIPKYYFREEIATMIGASVYTLGLLHFVVYPSKNNASIKDGKVYSLNIPLDVSLNFSGEFETKLKLKEELETEDYRVFTLNKGEVFLEETKLIQGVGAVEKFVNKILHAGKLPGDIPYSDILGLYLQCLDFNNFGFGVPALTLESIVSEIYRDSGDINRPFRKKIGRGGNVSEYSYKPVRINRIPALNSSFAAVTFEDMNQSVIDSIVRKREDIPEQSTPVEDTLYL